jgi:hypothetical protein
MRRGVFLAVFVVACGSTVDGTGDPGEGQDTGAIPPGSGSSSGSVSPSPTTTSTTGAPSSPPPGDELYVAFCTVAPIPRDTTEIPRGTGVAASWNGSELSVSSLSIPAEANSISARPMKLSRATMRLTKTDRFHRCFTFEGEQTEPYAYSFKPTENTCRLVKPAAGGTMPGAPDPDVSPTWACP